MRGALTEPGQCEDRVAQMGERVPSKGEDAGSKPAPGFVPANPGMPGSVSAFEVSVYRVYLFVYLAVLALAGVLGWAGWTVLT